MANKILKTLTIDGVPMDGHIGEIEFHRQSPFVIPTAWQTYYSAEQALDAGVYIYYAEFFAEPSDTTGARRLSIAIYKDNRQQIQVTEIDSMNEYLSLEVVQPIIVPVGQTLNLKAGVMSSKPITASTNMLAVTILKLF